MEINLFQRIEPYKQEATMQETFANYIMEAMYEAFADFLTADEQLLFNLNAKREKEIQQELQEQIDAEAESIKQEPAELNLLAEGFSMEQEEPTEADLEAFYNAMGIDEATLEERFNIGIAEYFKNILKHIAYTVILSCFLKISLLADRKASRRKFPRHIAKGRLRSLDYCLAKEINTYWRTVA